MGLEKYGQVLFPGASHKMGIWAKEDIAGSGNLRHITGLNEMAPELNKLSAEEKEAKVRQIRETVVMLEGALASNSLDVKDKKFWDNVKMIRSDNLSFWSKITVSPSNEAIYLDATVPEDIIKIAAIEAGGFPDIAPSLEAAKGSQRVLKFYLDKYEETAKSNVTLGIIEDRAKATLIDLYDNNLNKLNYVCKAIDPNSPQYKKSTPSAILYGNMRDFIEGKMEGTTKKESAKRFSEVAKLDMETLKLRALVKDANFYGFLKIRSGQIYEGSFDTPLGYNVTDVVEFLKNPLNEPILERLLKQTEKHWNE
jgi:hypothetical protein